MVLKCFLCIDLFATACHNTNIDHHILISNFSLPFKMDKIIFHCKPYARCIDSFSSFCLAVVYSVAALWIIFKLLPECRYVIITVCFSVCKSARLPENHWAGFYWTLCKSGAEWPEDPKWFCDWSGSLSLIMWGRWDGPWWRRPLSAVLVK